MSVEELLHYEWLVGAFVVGAVIGSFINVVIYRLPLEMSLVTPRSRCPSCETPIRWYHNVPILSWLLLRGRCARCRERIPLRYPAVELSSGLLWLAVAWRFPPSPQALAFALFVSAMLALFFTDWDHHWLPDKITLPLALVGLVAAPFNPALDLAPAWFGSGSPLARLASALVGAIAGYGVFFLMRFFWKELFGREALGGGDLKLMLGVGAFLGVGGVATTILFGSFAGTLLALPFLLTRRWSTTQELPFGCFLTPAAVFSALWGERVIRWYLGFLLP